MHIVTAQHLMLQVWQSDSMVFATKVFLKKIII